MQANTSIVNFEALMDYLKTNMENYSEEEKEILLLLFTIAYKKQPQKHLLFRNWSLHSYSKNYTPDEAIALCENFINYNLQLDLQLDMSFPEAIDLLKIAFPKIAH